MIKNNNTCNTIALKICLSGPMYRWQYGTILIGSFIACRCFPSFHLWNKQEVGKYNLFVIYLFGSYLVDEMATKHSLLSNWLLFIAYFCTLYQYHNEPLSRCTSLTCNFFQSWKKGWIWSDGYVEIQLIWLYHVLFF